MPIDTTTVSSLLNNLPAVFQEDRQPSQVGPRLQPNFLGRFLLAFEHVLLGLQSDPRSPGAVIGIEEVLGGIPNPDPSQPPLLAGIERYFEPGVSFQPAAAGGATGELVLRAKLGLHESAPKEFLPWLASWLALVLRDDLDPDPELREERQRNLIARASELYRWRGTKRGVVEFVKSYTTIAPLIDEGQAAFQVGVHSTLGVDSIIDGGAPFFFKATVRLPPARFLAESKKVAEVARAIIDQQKPAHTYYALDVVPTSTFQIAVQSTVGEDTILG